MVKPVRHVADRSSAFSRVVSAASKSLNASAGSPDRLRGLLGREIVVPAKTVGLSDSEQSMKGKVVDTNQEENSLWCTVSGDKRWYDSRVLAAEAQVIFCACLSSSFVANKVLHMCSH